MKVIQESFGQIDNQNIFSYTLKNDHGIEVTAINYGCTITKIVTPDKNGAYENIVLGHDTLEEYVNDSYFLGAVAGRVAGRIKGGSFELDGKQYVLAKNDHSNHLHGGIKGFNKVVWEAEIIEDGVQFSHISPNGEEGYPGNLTIQVVYTLKNDNELTIHYLAQTDKKTILTLTNHSYFNLSGNVKRDILQHTLKLKSEWFLELDDEFIPTGHLVEAKNTPFDFISERIISTGTTSTHLQNVRVGKGYDHPFLLTAHHDQEIILKDPENGRTLTVETDEPAVVVYSGNSLKPGCDFREVPSRKYLGICLETQGLPDSIHHSHFPSIILDKCQRYDLKTVYRFGITEN